MSHSVLYLYKNSKFFTFFLCSQTYVNINVQIYMKAGATPMDPPIMIIKIQFYQWLCNK